MSGKKIKLNVFYHEKSQILRKKTLTCSNSFVYVYFTIIDFEVIAIQETLNLELLTRRYNSDGLIFLNIIFYDNRHHYSQVISKNERFC